MRPLTRPLRLLAMMTAGLLLGTACGGDSQSPGVVQLLVAGDPVELAAFRTLAEAYEKAAPGTDLQIIEASDAKDLITRLSTSIAGGAPPDLFLINYRAYGQFAAKDAIEPIDEQLRTSNAIRATDFYPAPMEAFRWAGQQLCMPQNASSLALYYNRDLFQKYGVAEVHGVRHGSRGPADHRRHGPHRPVPHRGLEVPGLH
jgi:multiple sugar transport system substrate-binding protein